MATQQSEAATRHRWAAAQIAALVVGVAFLLPGVLGFVPGITTHYEMLDFAGHESGAELLGIFGVSVLAQHRAPGVRHRRADFVRTFNGARGCLIVSGLIYLLLSIYG